MKQSKSWLLLLVCGIVLVLASILVLINADDVIGLLMYIAGVALCGLGVALGVMAFLPAHKDSRTQLLLFALGNVLLGVVIMMMRNLFVLLIGLAIVLNGVGMVTEGLQLKKLGADRWMSTLLVGIGVILLGLIIAIFSKPITAAFGVALGLVMLVLGISLVIIALIVHRDGNKSVAA